MTSLIHSLPELELKSTHATIDQSESLRAANRIAIGENRHLASFVSRVDIKRCGAALAFLARDKEILVLLLLLRHHTAPYRIVPYRIEPYRYDASYIWAWISGEKDCRHGVDTRASAD
jgi:hypothetical protein